MADQKVNVVIVDDSALIRNALRRIMAVDQRIAVIAEAKDGQDALDQISRPELRQQVRIILLDIEMPRMDGLTALPKLRALAPQAKVIIVSSLSMASARRSMEALTHGADDYIVKPGSGNGENKNGFSRELLDKVMALAGLPGLQSLERSGVEVAVRQAPSAANAVALRPASESRPEAVAIASSTGGPQALSSLFSAIKGQFSSVPFFITQHMPENFTTLLAGNIAAYSGRPCREGKDGEVIQAGNVYVAPGNHHMHAVREGTRVVIRLTQDPPENFCRPAADPMLRSLAEIYGKRLLTVVLTGMGSDGLAGCRAVVNAGGTVIAQDKASSVVWGMPGAVATAGLCSGVYHLDKIPEALFKLFANADSIRPSGIA